jgi:DNA-binding NarL/FixJ family response regulator
MCGITPHALGSCSQTPILFRVYCENHPNHGISWVMQKIKLNKSRAPRASAPRHKTTSTKTPSNPPSRSKPTNKANSTISVLIADDHMFIREAVSALLSTDPGLSIVGEADNGRSALQQTLEKRPDVLLMDIGMPRLNGLEAARQVRNMAPDVKVILLTAFGNDQYIQQVVDGKIHGYILKDSPSNLLTHAIHEVAKGGRFYSPIISRRMRTIYDEATSRGDGKTSPPAVKLTSREVEVLQLIAEGGANKQIAGELNISIKTVEKHRQNLMDKLRIHDTASLTRYAISSGVIDNMVQMQLPLNMG